MNAQAIATTDTAVLVFMVLRFVLSSVYTKKHHLSTGPRTAAVPTEASGAYKKSPRGDPLVLRDSSDLDLYKRLSVTAFLEVVRLGAVLDDINRLFSAVLDKRRLDLLARDIRGADGRRTIIEEQDIVKNDRIALGPCTREFFDLEDLALGDLVLLAACFYDCEIHPDSDRLRTELIITSESPDSSRNHYRDS